MSWTAFDAEKSIGTQGSEGGTIVVDLKHEQGARITIEQDCLTGPFAITCGIYGWCVHTCFFSTFDGAESTCLEMQIKLDAILKLIPMKTDPECDAKTDKVIDAISEFVATYP